MKREHNLVLRTLGLLLYMAKTQPLATALIMGTSSASAVFTTLSFCLLRSLYGTAMDLGDPSTLIGTLSIACIMLVSVNLIGDILSVVSGALNQYASGCFSQATLQRLYEKTERLRLDALEDPKLYERLARAKRAITANRGMNLMITTQMLINVARCLVRIAGITALLSVVHPLLATVVVLAAAPGAIQRWLRGEQYYRIAHLQAPEERQLGYLADVLTSRAYSKEIRLFSLGSYLIDRWNKIREKLMEEVFRHYRRHAILQLVCDWSRNLGYGVGVALVGWLAVSGRVTVGETAATIVSLRVLQGDVDSLLQYASVIPQRTRFMKDVFDYLDIDEEEPLGTGRFPGLSRKLELRDVSFRYHGAEKDAVRNVSLVIEKGERVAIVGPNGAGKSTLAKILLGLYLPSSGAVLCDDIDIREYALQTFRDRVSGVFQNFVKLELTARQCIGLGSVADLAHDEKILGAAKASGADFVERLPKGLDTALGRRFDGAVDLSGGEWQRLAIARGMIRGSELLVLDEPTASLDPISESRLFQQYLRAMVGKTVVLISHRIGFARLADRIVVMMDGCIVEQGRHEELLARGGEYARLYRTQAEWYSTPTAG